MPDNLQDLTRGICDIFAARNKARNAEVPRPEVLDSPAPADPKARAKFMEQRESAENNYVDKLLLKGCLSPTETLFLASKISEALRPEI